MWRTCGKLLTKCVTTRHKGLAWAIGFDVRCDKGEA
jgi:hypothetical protein